MTMELRQVKRRWHSTDVAPLDVHIPRKIVVPEALLDVDDAETDDIRWAIEWSARLELIRVLRGLEGAHT